MKQFTAWFRSPAIAVVLQAILFGACHGYLLGLRQIILIAVSGMLIGVLVLRRKSVRRAIVFHAWADIFGSMIVRGLPFQ